MKILIPKLPKKITLRMFRNAYEMFIVFHTRPNYLQNAFKKLFASLLIFTKTTYQVGSFGKKKFGNLCMLRQTF